MEKSLLEYIIFLAELLIFIIGAYYLAISFFSFGVKKSKALSFKNHKFAVLIAAHNEEKVISGIIESKIIRRIFMIFLLLPITARIKPRKFQKALGQRLLKEKIMLRKAKVLPLNMPLNIFSPSAQAMNMRRFLMRITLLTGIFFII